MVKRFKDYIEREYNAEYRKGREKNFFLRNWYDENDNCWFELAKITSGCTYTVKLTDSMDDMEKFMSDYKLVRIFG